MKKLLRLDVVMSSTGLSRSMIYQLSAAGQFPEKVKISSQCIGWVEEEVDAWIESRIAQRETVGGEV